MMVNFIAMFFYWVENRKNVKLLACRYELLSDGAVNRPPIETK